MSSRSAADRSRGVSLAEAMVSLLLFTIVMIVALSLLFSMKSFADRQQVKTSARQAARRASDYLGSLVAGATDLNDESNPPSPNAVVIWYARGPANTPVQASYNNLPDGSAFGEPGTDIVSLAVPANPIRVPFTKWPGGLSAATAWLDYREGCPDDDALRRNFLELTGADSTGNQAKSGVLTVIDANGTWSYYQITGYQQFDCSSVDQASGRPDPIHVVATPGRSDGVNPPGGQPSLEPPIDIFLAGGMRFVSFRVRRGGDGVPNLEQKQGLFDPATDAPGTAFTPIVPNVEDFQVAYLYGESPDGSGRTIFNTFDPVLGEDVPVPEIAGLDNNGVPPQGTGSLWDATRVLGLRVSITARSAALRFGARNVSVRRGGTTLTNARPRSEDRSGAGPDDFEEPGATSGARVGDFDHHRMTSTLLIRNRMLGN